MSSAWLHRAAGTAGAGGGSAGTPVLLRTAGLAQRSFPRSRLAPSAHLAYEEGYSAWESKTGFLRQFLHCLKINVDFLSSQKEL